MLDYIKIQLVCNKFYLNPRNIFYCELSIENAEESLTYCEPPLHVATPCDEISHDGHYNLILALLIYCESKLLKHLINEDNFSL